MSCFASFYSLTPQGQAMSIDELLETHRKEKKELQKSVMALKKSVTKGDKKKKKEVDDEIEKLEKEFEEKCKLEIEQFNKRPAAPQTGGAVVSESSDQVVSDSNADDANASKSQKQSKAAKRREKKETANIKRQNDIEIQEKDNKNGPQYLEQVSIKNKLKTKGLQVKDVLSDGNCMYYAIADQYARNFAKTYDFQELRNLVSDHMKKNMNEYLPYVYAEDDDGMLTPEKYEEYCDKIKLPTTWGGQLELKVISDILNVPIEVVQAANPDILIGDNKSREKLIVTYHRHLFGSGEHYNSTEPIKTESNDN